jgi:hypothetical protein
LLTAIRLYWRAVPPHRRRTCLFRESCSRHVYRCTVELGLIGGLRALHDRVCRCRPGFLVLPPSEIRSDAIVVFRDGSAAPLTELALHLSA